MAKALRNTFFDRLRRQSITQEGTMTFKKAIFVRSAILAAVITAGSVHHFAFAESTNPPPQTDTDGGGGGVPDGSGDGGSGDPGTNQAGKATSPPSCYVVDPTPMWFPQGPPLDEDVYQEDNLTFEHIVYYDTGHGYQHRFVTYAPDDLSPIPGTYETWLHMNFDVFPQKIDAESLCTD